MLAAPVAFGGLAGKGGVVEDGARPQRGALGPRERRRRRAAPSGDAASHGRCGGGGGGWGGGRWGDAHARGAAGDVCLGDKAAPAADVCKEPPVYHERAPP